MTNTTRWMGTLSSISLAALALATGCGEAPDESTFDDVVDAQQALRSHDHEPALRLLSPLSAAIATSRRPVLRWLGDDNVRDRKSVV